MTLVLNCNELVKGEGEWQNIQEIVRLAFHSVTTQLQHSTQLNGSLQLQLQVRFYK